ncbi:GNAT family N-acetyltransferase [Halomonas caseinilytica]|uniref:Ribosomal-protein-serine acetyltransferase n=1 Tax=Halomonas caseinilytica TaxID=438744 RepID=A0A1M6XPF1_9GAMM|nr:GNAT family protein [Halomonas caseinilytica]SHL07851.1 ribosomal-protein-serine acetyltransferase [Halomonas caseinilytica]
MTVTLSRSREVSDELTMVPLDRHHASALFDAVDANRPMLHKWLPWVEATRSVDDSRAFIDSAMQEWQAGTAMHFAILWRGDLVGACGFNRIVARRRSAALGYWLAHDATGHGIVTACVRELLELGFGELRLHRIELHCGEHNAKSRAVAERLGFTEEGRLRECEWLGEQPVTHRVYGMLAPEWEAR